MLSHRVFSVNTNYKKAANDDEGDDEDSIWCIPFFELKAKYVTNEPHICNPMLSEVIEYLVFSLTYILLFHCHYWIFTAL